MVEFVGAAGTLHLQIEAEAAIQVGIWLDREGVVGAVVGDREAAGVACTADQIQHLNIPEDIAVDRGAAEQTLGHGQAAVFIHRELDRLQDHGGIGAAHHVQGHHQGGELAVIEDA